MRADRGAVAAKSDLKLAKWPIFAGRGGPLLSSMVVTTSSRDYYDILGVARTADESEIKKAFRRLAREHHPDVNQDPGAEDRFKEIAEAYEVLSDPQRQQMYDQFGDVALRDGFAENGVNATTFNVVTEGPHGRRSRLMFEKAFGQGSTIGIIAITDPTYDATRWWQYSEGIKAVSSATWLATN